MHTIDVGAILQKRAPKLYKWLPKALINALRRLLCEEQINYILENYWDYPPQRFIDACFKEWGVSYSIEGLDRLDKTERYLFVANHPFGGMDGMMIADELIKYFGDARVVVNDFLMNLEPLRPLWIPVNKHGAQSAEYARRFESEFMGDLPILTFPAGLCSRRRGKEVEDLAWRNNFLKRAYATNRKIVPIFVEGELSRKFYRIDKIRNALGIKFNVEMLLLPKEMFSQGGKHFKMIVGDVIDTESLHSVGSLREQVDFIRKKCYFLRSKTQKIG